MQQVLRSLYCCHHFQSCCRRLSCSQKAQETSQSAGFPVKELFFHCSTPFISFKKASVFVYIYPKKRDTHIKNTDVAGLFFYYIYTLLIKSIISSFVLLFIPIDFKSIGSSLIRLINFSMSSKILPLRFSFLSEDINPRFCFKWN